MKALITIDQNASTEAIEMLNAAESKIKNAKGYIKYDLFARIGCNPYDSSIYLLGRDGEIQAYFCNGEFWSMTNKTLVEL